MESMTITIESNRGTRMRFQVEHEPHFDLRSEEVDGLHSTVRTVESTLAESDDGRQGFDDAADEGEENNGEENEEPVE